MYQKLVIVGNLGRDPEMRYMSDGTAVTNFNVAVNRRWTDRQSGQLVDETTWFRVSAWGKRAETVNQYVSKGSKVLVEGRLRPNENGAPRTYTDNNGVVRASFEVHAEDVRFLSSNGSSEQVAVAQEEDDIPF